MKMKKGKKKSLFYKILRRHDSDRHAAADFDKWHLAS